MDKEQKDLYWGPNKILGVSKSDKKTPGGEEIVVLHLDDKYSQTLEVPAKSFKEFSTDKLVDASNFREKRNEKMAQEIVALIMEYDIKSSDIISLLNHVGTKLQNGFERASNWLWTGDDKTWIPGMSFMDNRTILEADNILKQVPNDRGEPEKK